VYKYQEKLLYVNTWPKPIKSNDNPSPHQNPSQWSMPYKKVYITTKDNNKLECWWIPFKKYGSNNNDDSFDANLPTVLFCHANAGNMGWRLSFVNKLYGLKCNIFMLEYRGYGNNYNISYPTETGLKNDADAAYEYIKNTLKCNNIFIFGRSLGGAVAIHLASQHTNDNELKGLIIENTFESIPNMIKYVVPFLDFDFFKKYFMKMDWNSIKDIKSIKQKILFLAALNDEIVPHIQMKNLYKNAVKCQSKEWETFPNATHNDTFIVGGMRYYQKISKFMHSKL